MFKLNVPIQKTSSKDNGRILVVEGYASDPSIDRTEEMFDKSAIKNMVDCISKGAIPIRVEHENKIYSDIGEWKEASMDEDGRLYVKGEIDTEFSLGNDIKLLLAKGKELSLSVGGRVLNAVFERVESLGKTIKVYKEIVLDEISVVKNPANYNTSLTLAKSVDWEASKEGIIQYSSQAQKLLSIYKSMDKLEPEEMSKKVLSSKERNALPDSAFAYVETVGDKKVRKLPIHDASHVRNALAVMGGAMGGVKGIPSDKIARVKAKIAAAAKKFGVDGKAAKKSVDVVSDVYAPLQEAITKMFSENPQVFKDVVVINGEKEECECECEEGDSDESSSNSCCDCEGMNYQMTSDDFALLTKLINITQNVTLPDVGDYEAQPALLQDSAYWEGLSQEMQIVLSGGYGIMPHHNLDYSVNEELVLWQLAKAVNQQSWYTPKDFTVIINHLYRHLKELNLVKKSLVNKEGLDKLSKSMFTKEEAELLQHSYEYHKGNVFERPSVGQVSLTDEQIKKAHDLYIVYKKNPFISSIINQITMDDIKKEVTTPVEPAEAKVEAPAAEVVETEVAPVEPVVPTTEEVVPEAPVTAAPEVEVPAEVVEPAESVEKRVTENVTKSFGESLSKLTEIVKGMSEKFEQTEDLRKSVSDINTVLKAHGEVLEKLATMSAGRKSYANMVALEKNFSGDVSKDAASKEETIKKFQSEGLSFADALKKWNATQE